MKVKFGTEVSRLAVIKLRSSVLRAGVFTNSLPIVDLSLATVAHLEEGTDVIILIKLLIVTLESVSILMVV
jgi:hypothetical protein